MEFWRRKKEDVIEAITEERGSRSTALAVRPIPEDALILIPLRNAVLFPGVISPITIGRASSVAAASEAARNQLKVGFILQRDPQTNDIGPKDLHRVGTAGQVVRYAAQAGGANHLMVQGERRFRVLEFLEGWPFLVASVAWIPEAAGAGSGVEARFIQLKTQAAEAISLLPNAADELTEVVRAIESPGQLADMVANLLDIKNEEKQDLLETFELVARLDKVLAFLAKRVEVMRLSKEIGDKTRKEFDSRQREHVLREQMRQIQKELGDEEDSAAEIDGLKKAIDEAGFPEETLKHVKKEFKRLSRMGEQSGESSMLRTWLEWMTELPWKASPQKEIVIQEAKAILDEDHFGLEKIKRRILEYLAVRKLNPEGKSPILCFVGPPGVGKTSLGQSIARVVSENADRTFQRVSLGGTHDEAEIRGHRRTYIGAMPGNIIAAIKRAGSRGGVLMLDEIDKLGAGGFHGDPSSALLEVLDPEQNSKFRDNYLGVDFDLSRVMFIATANQLDTIPGPLRDRMEIIQLPGYTEEEKLQIARRYLIKRQLEVNGLKEEQVTVTDAALASLVGDYTREAGVRNLERALGSVLRSVAMKVAEQSVASITVDAGDLHSILGARKFENEIALRTSTPGVATGLAWTPVGGDILFIEASKTPGTGKLILTGQLGDVMKESAQAALTLVKNYLDQPLDKLDIHIHVPAGATPKDGPSAGVAMFLSLVSLISNKPIRSGVAMTGEISLRGLVMPIGGLKEKSLAALRAGIKTVMVPKRNEKDLEDIPAEAKAKLEFVFLEKVEDAVRTAIGELPELKRAA